MVFTTFEKWPFEKPLKQNDWHYEKMRPVSLQCFDTVGWAT